MVDLPAASAGARRRAKLWEEMGPYQKVKLAPSEHSGAAPTHQMAALVCCWVPVGVGVNILFDGREREVASW